jgi:competence protein ComEA
VTDRRAAFLLAAIALVGATARFVLNPAPDRPPGEIAVHASGPAGPAANRRVAAQAARLARPLAPGERIDVDQADVTDITRLPRIGPALAQRIVADRERRGAFGSLEGLDRVSGVGPAVLAEIAPYVTFSGHTPP